MQFSKALPKTAVNPWGKVTGFNDLQSRNTFIGMKVALFVITIVEIPVHPLNENTPMLVKPEGRVVAVIVFTPRNASFAIDFTGKLLVFSGMVRTPPMNLLETPVIATSLLPAV